MNITSFGKWKKRHSCNLQAGLLFWRQSVTMCYSQSVRISRLHGSNNQPPHFKGLWQKSTFPRWLRPLQAGSFPVLPLLGILWVSSQREMKVWQVTRWVLKTMTKVTQIRSHTESAKARGTPKWDTYRKRSLSLLQGETGVFVKITEPSMWLQTQDPMISLKIIRSIGKDTCRPLYYP